MSNTPDTCPQHPDYDGVGDPPDDDCEACAQLHDTVDPD